MMTGFAISPLPAGSVPKVCRRLPSPTYSKTFTDCREGGKKLFLFPDWRKAGRSYFYFLDCREGRKSREKMFLSVFPAKKHTPFLNKKMATVENCSHADRMDRVYEK